MSRFRISAIAGLLVSALLITPAAAQDIVVSPFGYRTYRPVVTYSPVVTTYAAPVVTSYRPVVTYPGVVRYRAPIVTYRQPVVRYRAPVVTYRQPVVRYRTPVVTYRPLVPAYSPAYAPVYLPAGSLVVRPKVYVPGQPVRNALRAITP